MIAKRTLVVGGLVAALAVPAGVAVAATATPSPGPRSTEQPGGPGNGPGGGFGPMMGGYGDPGDCPFHDSAEMQQWREQRDERRQLPLEERQKLMQQHRERMQELMGGAATSS